MTRETIERSRPAAGRGEAGFTLLEMVVALAITVGLTAAIFSTFRVNSRLARVETARTQMQQSVRAVHLEVGSRLRVAGRGGLFQGDTLQEPSRPRRNRGSRRQCHGRRPDDRAGHGLEPPGGRGHRCPDRARRLHHADLPDLRQRREPRLPGAAGRLRQPDRRPGQARSGEIQICDRSPAGFAQPLGPLRDAIDSGSDEALILSSSADAGDYGVVRIDASSSLKTSTLCNPGDAAAGVTLEFVVSGDGGRADQYRQLAASGLGLPASLTSVSFAALLEEYRYFVRDVREVTGDGTTRLLPRFSRARLYPNTGTPWGADAATRAESAATDIADDLLDFQVSLGLDSSQGGGAIEDGTAADRLLSESDDGTSDDWLFNSADDDPGAVVWARPGTAGLTRPWLRARLFYVRINTVGRALQPELGYEAPALTALEDRTYSASASDDPDSPDQRQFRRWLLTTTIDLRNL